MKKTMMLGGVLLALAVLNVYGEREAVSDNNNNNNHPPAAQPAHPNGKGKSE
jgi:hypothetical protein